jgi:hypothetical protein
VVRDKQSARRWGKGVAIGEEEWRPKLVRGKAGPSGADEQEVG